MKNTRLLILGVLAVVLVAVGAYLWTSALMDSIFAYRSPLRANPPAPGEQIGAPTSRTVVFVLIDALREDTSRKADVMPFLNELRDRGAWATMHSRPPSYSEPGYTVLLTGAWPDVSDGPTINVDYEQIPTWTQDDLFSASQRAGLKTAVSGYYWFEKLIPQAAVSAHFYTPGEDAAADRAVTDAALPWLHGGGYQFVLIHIDQVDYAGHHEGGPRDPRWNAAARRADDLLREIVATLDLSKDTLFVASDHGQIDAGGHGGQEPIVLVEPWVLVGAGVKPGYYGDVNMVDVAPTLAALLGTSIPASSQGHVMTAMLNLSPERLAAIGRTLASQQAQLVASYESAIGQSTVLKAQGDVVTSSQAAMDAARLARLNSERMPRAVVALILAVLPAAVLAWKRRRSVGWLIAAALLYLILFNLRYAILSGRTYSLSSVAGATDLVLYCLITGGAAFVISWLISAPGLGTFRRGPSQAALRTLALGLMVIYLLALPVLFSLALNGPLVTWTLPDFLSTFLAFLSGIQMLAVSAVSLLLAGIAAVVGRLRS